MSLEPFHPLVGEWFESTLGAPTAVQTAAWPAIADGQHVVVTAPTGSGKTLTAFLWALNQLLTGAWEPGGIRVLYVSPLKALNNDIRRNLTEPLRQLETLFHERQQSAPAIQTHVRSGDTPQSERRRMLRHPPEILITTPESLNLLVSSRRARPLFTGLRTVILDEIHAIAGNKRGTHLITAVDRLVPLAGEFQRVALSATINPMETVAAFVGGYRLEMRGDEPHYAPRDVNIIRAPMAKKLQVRVEFPPDARETLEDGTWWPSLVRAFRRVIDRNRSTLLFANSRQFTEKAARLLNENQPEQIAYSHHGSLSHELRATVEQKLKDGELSAIVATNSLELGIDVGPLDEIVLIQTPGSVASALQRIGRAGHRVGEVSRGVIFPTHGQDFINAAVMARLVADGDIEPIHLPRAPLDVLAQVILAMAGVEDWRIDDLYNQIRASWPYRHLHRQQFDLVLDMLAGRYSEARLRELSPRIALDRLAGTVQATPAALPLIYRSGGTIPDRGYYKLRLQDSRAVIGELDEEFVWERSEGDVFAVGAQTWRINHISEKDVHVVPTDRAPTATPFWKGEIADRSFHLADRTGRILEDWNARLDDPGFADHLRQHHFLDDTAAAELLDVLKRQRAATGADLPHRHHLLVETVRDLLHGEETTQVVIHTLWGGRVNRPFALALAAAWEEKYGYPVEIGIDDSALILMAPHEFDTAEVLSLVTPENLDRLLRRQLESSGFFGARFRENASRALLLPRHNPSGRTPLWLSRLRAKRLLGAVRPFEDFPVVVETWRTCLQDEFDRDSLLLVLDELQRGDIRVSEAHTATPSPLCSNLLWASTNEAMYESDRPLAGGSSTLSEELLKQITHTAALRPRIDDKLAADFQHKAQRLAQDYAPRNAMELVEWTRERLLLPEPEWQQLLEAVQRDTALEAEPLLEECRPQLARLQPPGSATPAVAAIEAIPRLARALDVATADLKPIPLTSKAPSSVAALQRHLRKAEDLSPAPEEEEATPLADYLAEWLRYYAPLEVAYLTASFGVDVTTITDALDLLESRELVVIDTLTRRATEPQVCDTQNLEILLRQTRARRRRSIEARPITDLPLFLATFQGLAIQSAQPSQAGTPVPLQRDSATAYPDDLPRRLEQLLGLCAPAAQWESEFLPARFPAYRQQWLDHLMRDSGLLWFGCGHQRVSFLFPEDRELIVEEGSEVTGDLEQLFPDLAGRYRFEDLLQHTGLPSADLANRLWQLAWEGRVSSDTFDDIRKGILNRFKPASLGSAGPRRPSRRGSFERWRSSRPFGGHWFALDTVAPPADPLEEDNLLRDRVRLLLDRYGILFRELLERELPALRWSRVFRLLRLMELSEEIIGGHFFAGLPGLQFLSRDAFRLFESPLPECPWWLNAADPASLCGTGLDDLPHLPKRHPSSHLVYRGAELILTSARKGKDLTFHVPPDDDRLPDVLPLFQAQLRREFQPWKAAKVETVNGRPVAESPYRSSLLSLGFRSDYKALTLRESDLPD